LHWIVAIIVVANGKKHGVATMKMSKMMMNAITLFFECHNFEELTIKYSSKFWVAIQQSSFFVFLKMNFGIKY
jgi:hypothetical protein